MCRFYLLSTGWRDVIILPNCGEPDLGSTSASVPHLGLLCAIGNALLHEDGYFPVLFIACADHLRSAGRGLGLCKMTVPDLI